MNSFPNQSNDALILDINGYEGPIDLLLDLARSQKVDLTQISILSLVKQYLEFIDRAQKLELTIASDYLVMAAWLVYLKSRLLVPQVDDENVQDAQELAELLAFRLRQLEYIQKSARDLQDLQKQHPRGMPQGAVVRVKTKWNASMGDLISAYGEIARRNEDKSYDPPKFDLMSAEEAIHRISRLLRGGKWISLMEFLPKSKKNPLYQKSALAACISASLELTKQGNAEIKQETPFGRIDVRGV